MKQIRIRVLILILLVVAAAAGWWNWRQTRGPKRGAAAEFAGLDESKQKQIWDTEHVTFEIETHIGRKLIAALGERSANRLAGFFRSGFEGVVPRRLEPIEADKSSITETVFSVNAAGSTSIDVDEFTQFLIEGISRVREIRQGRFRVLKIARVADEGNADAWQLSVLLTVGGLNSEGGPATYESLGRMRCRFADDDDIVAGRIIDSWSIDSETVRSSRSVLMQEATARFGLDRLPITDNWTCGLERVRQYRFQTAVEDFNGDGFLDIALATADDQKFLLQWNPKAGQYEDVTTALGLPRRFLTEKRAYLACWVDFDDDGDADLLLGETLYRNVDGKAFEPVPGNGGLDFEFNPMGCVVADFDADGLLDLYVLYQRSRNTDHDKTPTWVDDDVSGACNQLWRNRGDGTFVETAEAAAATGGHRHSFAATWLHANDDHYPDLYVANDFARNSLLINRGDGSFHDVASESGVGDFATSMGVAAGDADGDGHPEIYVANMYSKMGRRIIAQVSADDYPEGLYRQLVGSCAGNQLYSRAGDHRHYRELSEQLGVNAVGWAYAPAFVDFDGDGLLDLYATTGFLSFNRQKPDG